MFEFVSDHPSDFESDYVFAGVVCFWVHVFAMVMNCFLVMIGEIGGNAVVKGDGKISEIVINAKMGFTTNMLIMV